MVDNWQSADFSGIQRKGARIFLLHVPLPEKELDSVPITVYLTSRQRSSTMSQENDLSRKYELLKQQIADIGFICTGSLMSVYQKCGSARCPCGDDPDARHGPYNRWTRKVRGKTVTRTLTDEQTSQCRRYIENHKKLKQIIAQMRQLSVQFIEGLK